MQRNLTEGPITRNILLFALPLMLGNLLQQTYNIADTWVVGQFLGADALAAVGSSYTLITFLTSIIFGLCMGSGAAVSMQYGKKEYRRMRQSIFLSFAFIAAITIIINIIVYAGLKLLLHFLEVPYDIQPLMRQYLLIIFVGISATFLYNYFASLLRAIGNSVVPLLFLAVSTVLNIVLDLLCVLVLDWGIAGAAIATVFSQFVSAIGILLYTIRKFPELLPQKADMHWEPAIMAAFAAAVKIDSFAYMPVQDFGNAFSTYVAQNYGAGKTSRIKKGIRSAVLTSGIFCVFISCIVVFFAQPLMQIFISHNETDIISAGIQYLRIEGACYIGIGILFLLYGYYRAINRPAMSVVLTVISLGTRVVLAYVLSAIPSIGITGIWGSTPIGWALADLVGSIYYLLL